MASPKTILVLGSSYAGLSAAHYTLKHTIPALPSKGEGYTVTLVSPNTEFFVRPASVRALVSKTLLAPDRVFFDFQKHFKQYPDGKFTFIQGTATAADTTARTVTIIKPSGETDVISYHALVIATGSRPFSPLLGLHKDTQLIRDAWNAFQEVLPKAKSIVIGGGGPAGVETAGELGDFLNEKAGFFESELKNPKVAITVVTNESRILPKLRPAIGNKAEQYLAKIGVKVIKNTKVDSVTPTGAGEEDSTTNDLAKITASATVKLSNGETLEADLFIPAYGTVPNTSFLPKSILTEKGFVDVNPDTLRVDKAGSRVYTVGDVSSVSHWGILDIYDGIPVAMANLKRDLLHAATAEKTVPQGQDKILKANLKETQLVPIGRSKGVGVIFGWRVPSWFVWALKGREYGLWWTTRIPDGTKWNKE